MIGTETSVPETIRAENRENIRKVEAGQQEVEQPVQVSREPVTTPETSEQQQTFVPATPVQHDIPAGNVEESVIANSPTPPQVGQQQQHSTGSAQQQQQKESVFVRLSNRIKTLERNQTLTASYLEELSRRFKKQNEENHNANEGTKNFMNESQVKFKVLEDLYRVELRSLRRNTDDIRERLFNVQLQRSVLILLCLLQFIFIISICIWAKKRFGQLESQIQGLVETNQGLPTTTNPTARRLPPTNVPILNRHDVTSSLNLSMRKRLNSDMSTTSSLNSIDKSKKIKKKKKKLPELKPVNIKSGGPASAPVDYPGKFEYPTLPTATSAYDVVSSSYNYKENINPATPVKTEHSPNRISPSLERTAPTSSPLSNIPGGGLLSTQVDSPFQMISSTSTNFFVDSGVSTSSRFALLASPGPSNVGTKVGLRRSGSLTSLDSSSTSSYGASVKTGSHNVVNGHGDSLSQGSNGSGKKRKNKGLKALMPKIFDR